MKKHCSLWKNEPHRKAGVTKVLLPAITSCASWLGHRLLLLTLPLGSHSLQQGGSLHHVDWKGDHETDGVALCWDGPWWRQTCKPVTEAHLKGPQWMPTCSLLTPDWWHQLFSCRPP